MAEEEHAKKNDSTNTTFYVAVIALVIALAAIGYAATQGGQFSSFDKRITQNEEKQNAADAKLAAQQTLLDSFQKQLNTRLADLTVTLSVYYDSDCAFCNNDKLLLLLDNIEPGLKSQGITLERIDVSGKSDETLQLGIDRVPAFYASGVDLAKEPAGKYLQNTMTEWEMTGGFDFYNAQGGLVLTPRGNTEMLTAPCLSNVTTLQYFYSETCEHCKRLTAANGTAANPASNENFKNVVEETLPNALAKFGISVQETSHCIPIRAAIENLNFLGVNKSDAQLCVETQGQDKSVADEMLAARYHISTTPMFVANCRYVFNAVSEENIVKWICAAKPSLAGCKAQTATATPTVTASVAPSVAPTATANATASVAASAAASATPSTTPTA